MFATATTHCSQYAMHPAQRAALASDSIHRPRSVLFFGTLGSRRGRSSGFFVAQKVHTYRFPRWTRRADARRLRAPFGAHAPLKLERHQI